MSDRRQQLFAKMNNLLPLTATSVLMQQVACQLVVNCQQVACQECTFGAEMTVMF